MLAVVAYHAGANWLPGGFLGVEVFFVVSGFLITTLLAEELESTERIDLAHFWLRRARRLLPALYLTIAAVCLFARIWAPDAVQHLKGSTVAALGYVMNWYQVFTKQSYFDALGRPPLLRHLWSLAIEEQFYLVWPLAFLGLSRLWRGDRRRMAATMITLAAASALLMSLLYPPDRDPSRVYYGTDTRASGLLLGAALAMLWNPWRRRGSMPVIVTDAMGVVGIVGLAVCALRYHEVDRALYRGGFLIVGILTASVIAAVVVPRSLLSKLLSHPILVWVGLRSYGLYLWHWPVMMLTRPQDFSMPLRVPFQLFISVALTELSYRFVERPIRRGAVGDFLRARRADLDRPSLLVTPIGAALMFASLGAIVIGFDIATAKPIDPLAGPSAAPFKLATITPTTVSAKVGSIPSTSTTRPGPPPTPPVLPRRIVVVGDSVGKTLVRNAPKEIASSLTITSGAIEGCGLVDGAIKTAAHWHVSFQRCGDVAVRWVDSATQANAQVVVITVGAWEVFDLKRIEGDLSFGSKEWIAYFTPRLHRAVKGLVNTGAQVALVEVPCFRPVDGGGLKALPERGDDTRTRLLNSLMRAEATADPVHVHFVPGPPFCDDPNLARNLDDRWDGVHYYRPGAALVWTTITPALLALPVPPGS